MAPLTLCLYGEPRAPRLDLRELAGFAQERFPSLMVEVREEFITFYLCSLPQEAREEALERLALAFARAKVRNPARQESFPLLRGEVDYEKRRLSDAASRPFGLLYDGLQVMALYRSLLPREERHLSFLHVAFTHQLLGTWEDSDRRYHARASLYGFPCLISTTGLVEAPARPREYYLLKQQYAAMGMGDAVAVLEPSFKGRVLEHDDPRLAEVVKGYLLQALFYHLEGEPFCADPSCSLYNSHWQEEVLRAQLGGRLCPRHQERLEELRRP